MFALSTFMSKGENATENKKLYTVRLANQLLRRRSAYTLLSAVRSNDYALQVLSAFTCKQIYTFKITN